MPPRSMLVADTKRVSRSVRPVTPAGGAGCWITPTAVTPPAWPLSSATGRADDLKIDAQHRPAGVLPHREDPTVWAGAAPGRPKRYGVLAETELALSRADCSSRGTGMPCGAFGGVVMRLQLRVGSRGPG